MEHKEYDFLTFIGRMSPAHFGHISVIREGLDKSEKLIILLGSAFSPRTIRNPFTFEERVKMIRSALTSEENDRTVIAPLMDVMYNDELWTRNVQTTVSGIVTQYHKTPHRPAKIGLIGHKKDNSSYYLSIFPQWPSVAAKGYKNLSSTDIREAYFDDKGLDVQQASAMGMQMPSAIVEFLKAFKKTDHFENLKREYEFCKNYKASWAKAPYAPTFVTTDAVVIQSGHILLVKRRAFPGKGLWALPGGFVKEDETLMNSCIRELREETKIKVPEPVLKGNIRNKHVFDEPFRSNRGRTITTAYHIALPPNEALPKVKGSDDAEKAKWIPLSELDPQTLFEDHYHIIQYFIGGA